ncbi:N-acetyltransferase [Arcanobacterium haemolyticum]|nr:N-acetyltransferase [Arcanobacterium haemolyticum]
MEYTIREAVLGDGQACADIFAPYVRETAINFEVDEPNGAEMSARIEAALKKHTWLVAEAEGVVIGYAYGASFSHRAAYQWCAETSIYVSPCMHGRGVGESLYLELIERLRRRGYAKLIGIITEPNRSSKALHRRCGFEEEGTLRQAGWKLGAWHDVTYMSLDLRENNRPPLAIE